jgi:hypothetical protein
MAQFRYLGEPPQGFVESYGPCKKITVPQKSGVMLVLEDPTGFPVGDIIPFDFTDETSIAAMRVNPRFQEV